LISQVDPFFDQLKIEIERQKDTDLLRASIFYQIKSKKKKKNKEEGDEKLVMAVSYCAAEN
jgi:sRNA-binding carbon storage regulator CsrA